MEVLQDIAVFIPALLGIIGSVGLLELCLQRLKNLWGAFLGTLSALIWFFVISECSGWFSAMFLGIARSAAYGRTFSFAAFGGILYIIARQYQLARERNRT